MMRFIVGASQMLKSLQRLIGVVGNNSVLPILENFLFDLKGNELTITASDLEMMMRVRVEVQDAQGEGQICIPAKMLLEYFKNLPDQPITLQYNPKDRSIEIITSEGKYHISGEAAEDFPKAPESTADMIIQIPSIALIESITNTIFAVVTGDSFRPAMTGVLFDFGPDAITFVATDSHRLVRYTRKDLSCPQEGRVVVPRKPLQQLKNTLPPDNSLLELSFTENHLFVATPDLSLSCRLIDGQFPDYQAVIPIDNPYKLTVNRQEFVSALKRISIFSNKTTYLAVLDINGNSLQLEAQDVDFSYEGKETMSCQYTGEDMKIAFNVKLMAEMADILDSEEIELHLSTPIRAGIFKPVKESNDEDDLMMLLMPLMIGG